MREDANIVFIHKGDIYKNTNWYLPYVLNQARSTNNGSDVVLIGDGQTYDGVRSVALNDLRDGSSETFRKHYRHQSSNKAEYEQFCWLRWFYLLDYMRREGVRSVLHLDSDVLLCSSLAEIRKCYANRILDCALMVPKQDHNSFKWCASGHTSFWTIAQLEEFCAFCIESFCRAEYVELYEQKWKWHLANKQPGGICDMTTLYLFWKDRKDRITNLAMNENGNVFDLAIGTGSNYHDDEYATKAGRKEVVLIDQKPCFRQKEEPAGSVRAHALHFQGTAKKYIPTYYSGKKFKGKAYSDTIVRIQSAKSKLKTILTSNLS